MEADRLYNDKHRIKRYIQLVKAIIDDKELTNHKVLEPFRANLKILFSWYNLRSLLMMSEADYWTRYIDYCVYLVKNIKDDKLDQKTIYTLSEISYPKACDIIKQLLFIYAPEVAYNDFRDYIWKCNTIFLNAVSYWLWNDIDTNNNELDTIYNYLKDKYQNDKKMYDLINDKGAIVVIILGYLHYHHLYSNEIFDYYLNHLDEYIEKLKIDDLWVVKMNHDYDFDKAKYIFDNFDIIFKQKGLIK